MRRGDIVIVAQKGVYEGKPRPAVVVQALDVLDSTSAVIVCLLAGEDEVPTGAFHRIVVGPTAANGLRKTSIVMADRIATIRRHNIGAEIGRLDRASLDQVDTALALILGLA